MIKRLPKGFVSPLVLLAVGLIVGIGITFAYFQLKSKPAPQPQPTTTQTTSQPSPTSKASPTASPDETANWQNVDGGAFFVKIPPSWQVAENSATRTYISGSGYIIFNKNKGQISEQVNNEIKGKITSNLNVKNRNIGGKQVMEYFGCLNPEACEVVHYILIPTTSNEYITVEFINNDPVIGGISSLPIYDQILSTFKFIK